MTEEIDYIAEAERLKHLSKPLLRHALGIRERIELDHLLFGGESGAASIAKEVGVSIKAVERRRAALRRKGYRLRTPEGEWTWRDSLARKQGKARG